MTRQEMVDVAMKGYTDQLRIQGWHDMTIGEEILLGYAVDALIANGALTPTPAVSP